MSVALESDKYSRIMACFASVGRARRFSPWAKTKASKASLAAEENGDIAGSVVSMSEVMIG